MSDCRKCADYEWCAEHEECGLFNQKTMTNADRIRSMTDEEMAEACVESVACFVCPMTFNCDGRKIGKDACKAKWLDWLKQEVTENSTT